MKLKVYKDGARYITGGLASIEPALDPVEEYDLDALTEKELEDLKHDMANKKLLKKAKKIK